MDDAKLLATELVTNAVRHLGSEGIDFAFAVDTTRIRIEVSDAGTQPIRPRPAGEDRGYGLILVGELAHRWGVERRRDGKSIWIEIELLP